MAAEKFWQKTKEKEDMNQYWYSAKTIDFLVAESVRPGTTRCAFVSTPSIYFSLPDSELKSNSKVFDIDPRFAKAAPTGFVQYDFNAPEAVPAEIHHTFDFILIDPPFIVREVWEKYATTAKLLLRETRPDETEETKPRILISSVAENAAMLEELLGVKPIKFQPSIPHLVYQYNLFANYSAPELDAKNPEIPDDD